MINKKTIKIALVLASILFFNVLYSFIIKHQHSLDSKSALNISLDEFENNPTDLKGKENTFMYLSYFYILFFIFSYKTLREQIIIFILFYFILYMTYKPFNCFCKDAKFWTCTKGTSPSDPECKEVYKLVKEVDDIITRDMIPIRRHKSLLYKSMLELFIQVPTFEIPKFNEDMLKINELNETGPIKEINLCNF